MPRTKSSNPKISSSAAERTWSVPSLREPRYSQSLGGVLAILTCFSGVRPVLGIADIADELGMSRSTTHRYVITLLALGYLEQGASRKYRLGLKVTDLGMAALNSTGLREHAHPYLEELRQRTSYTTNLGCWMAPTSSMSVVCVVFVVGRAGSILGSRRARGCLRIARRWASCCWPTCLRVSSAS